MRVREIWLAVVAMLASSLLVGATWAGEGRACHAVAVQGTVYVPL